MASTKLHLASALCVSLAFFNLTIENVDGYAPTVSVSNVHCPYMRNEIFYISFDFTLEIPLPGSCNMQIQSEVHINSKFNFNM